jgi:mono/diheme cytochrome c family protein
MQGVRARGVSTRGKNPLYFREVADILQRHMSRLAVKFFAAVCLSALPLLAQVTPGATPAPAPRKLTLSPPAAASTPVAPAAPAAPTPDPNALKWNAESLEYNAKPGEESAPFHFFATNVSQSPVIINALRTSCGCTVAQLPTTPYTLLPGSNVPVNATMDLRGKQGVITKTVTADTSSGIKSLLVKVSIPAAAATAANQTPGAPGMGDRAKNIQTALADRQAVFKGDCASCHVEKGKGKFGAELYAASCGICHDAEHRAAMVTDLKVPRGPRDIAFWQKWIMEGKPGTMMPAFGQAHGGPLTQEQIDSLTTYCYQNFPKGPQTATTTPTSVNPSVVVPPAPAKN